MRDRVKMSSAKHCCQQAQLFIAYISGGKRFPLEPLDNVTLITFLKDPAPYVKWRRFAKG
jgi:hypothetical protein